MAEGLCRHLQSKKFTPFSAGIRAQGLNPLAVKVMAEIGIDISKQKSCNIEQLPMQTFDYVVTVCDHASKNCPFMPAVKRFIHHAFDDPPILAQNAKNEQQTWVHYRRVRHDIKTFIIKLESHLNR